MFALKDVSSLRVAAIVLAAAVISALAFGGAAPAYARVHNAHFHDGHWNNFFIFHHEGEHDHHDGGEEESETLGSIEVCKIIVDTEGDTRTDSPLPEVTMTIVGGTNGSHVLPDTVLTTPLTATAHFFDANEFDDAACTTYAGLAIGEYHYGQESLSDETDYDEALYNDQFDTPVHSAANFYQYGAEGNENADGTITLTDERPDRTLVVLNTYTAGDADPEPVDACLNVNEFQAEGPCADTLCEAPAVWNMDSQACVAPVVPEDDEDEPENDGGSQAPAAVTPPPSGGGPIWGGGPIGGGSSFGSIGGTSGGTGGGQVLGESCGVYVNKYIRFGRKNDSDQVTKLQEFLNKWEKAGLTVNGTFDAATLDAVKKFQSHYLSEILSPWGITLPTGIVYKTTLRHINNLECPGLVPQIPPLTPWAD